jgi:hypothetical protein
MAGKIVADTLEHSTAGSIATNYVVKGSAKAWLDQTSRAGHATNDSLNISSVADTSAGKMSPSFSSSMNAANYSAVCSGISQYADNGAGGADFTACDTANRASSSCRLITLDYNDAGNQDAERVDLAVFGELA